jgi:hypothetical protein
VGDRAIFAGFCAGAAAFCADLLTKSYAVTHLSTAALVFNHKPAELPKRIAMCVIAIAVAAVLAHFARQRGIGRIWGAWIGVGLLVAGVLGNGISTYLWSRGVPDFFNVAGDEYWNLADFEIAIGLTGGIVSIAATAILAYVRERLNPVPPPPSGESASG